MVIWKKAIKWFFMRFKFSLILSVYYIFFEFYSFAQSYSEETLKTCIVPIIKVGPRVGSQGWVLKYPVGTAFLVGDTLKNSNRLFLVTARHVIENDSVTICLINLTSKSENNSNITSVRKYVINKSEWKFHPDDLVDNSKDKVYNGYDIAIAEIYMLRISLDEQKLWHRPLDLRWFTNISFIPNETVKIVAFPYVDKLNFDRGLMLGDLETENGIIRDLNINPIQFAKNKHIQDLCELLITNPKFRPGYSGGMVFKSIEEVKVFGMAMGMSDVRDIGDTKYCFAFFVKAENILKTLNFNYLK
jgi:hypothetical protein